MRFYRRDVNSVKKMINTLEGGYTDNKKAKPFLEYRKFKLERWKK